MKGDRPLAVLVLARCLIFVMGERKIAVMKTSSFGARRMNMSVWGNMSVWEMESMRLVIRDCLMQRNLGTVVDGHWFVVSEDSCMLG